MPPRLWEEGAAPARARQVTCEHSTRPQAMLSTPRTGRLRARRRECTAYWCFVIGLYSVAPFFGTAMAAESEATTAVPKADPAAPANADIEAILANPLGNTAYVNESRCIPGGGFGNVEVVDDRNLVFEGRRGTLWWNRLRQRCLGLHSNMRLTMERRSWRFCARDRFRGVGRSSTELPSTICELGNFVELDPESSELLRRAIEASRRNTVVGATVRRAAR